MRGQKRSGRPLSVDRMRYKICLLFVTVLQETCDPQVPYHPYNTQALVAVLTGV